MAVNENEKRLDELQSAADISGHELYYPDEKTLHRVMNCMDKNELEIAHLKAWTEACPKVLEIATHVLKASVIISEQAGTSQKAIADKISDTSKIFGAVHELAKRASSPEERMKILEVVDRIRQGEVLRIQNMKDMNDSNNSLWKTLAKCTTGLAMVVVAGIVVVIAKSKE